MLVLKNKRKLWETIVKRTICDFLTVSTKPYFCCMENTYEAGRHSLQKLSFDSFREEVLQDYRWVCISREASLLGRKEVLTGKAKFGIFGDGKELAQVAMAKFFQPGDFRSG